MSPVVAFTALLVVFSACARTDTAAKGAFIVGFSQMESDNPWRIAQTRSLRDEAAKRGVRLVVTDAQGQTAKQVADVEDLVAQRVSLILLAPREFQGLAPALEAAKRANIPVILLDREAAGIAGQDYVTFLGSNFIEQGRRAAEWLAQATNGKADLVRPRRRGSRAAHRLPLSRDETRSASARRRRGGARHMHPPRACIRRL
jgi:ribose transport system substrate-binding protein